MSVAKNNDNPDFVGTAIFKHKRTVISIELPFFSFCAMINGTRRRACPHSWMTIGRQEDKAWFLEVNGGTYEKEETSEDAPGILRKSP